MAISVRMRFEVLKRDDFTCRYCARKTPEVVLEVDHIVPVCEGGLDDPINLVTACWDCNRGKAGVPLDQVQTGEDPYERALALLERERQLREYNEVLASIRVRKEEQAQELLNYWCEETGKDGIRKNEWQWLVNELERTAAEDVRNAMVIALARGMTRDWRYVGAILRNWREDRMARAERRVQ